MSSIGTPRGNVNIGPIKIGGAHKNNNSQNRTPLRFRNARSKRKSGFSSGQEKVFDSFDLKSEVKHSLRSKNRSNGLELGKHKLKSFKGMESGARMTPKLKKNKVRPKLGIDNPRDLNKKFGPSI